MSEDPRIDKFTVKLFTPPDQDVTELRICGYDLKAQRQYLLVGWADGKPTWHEYHGYDLLPSGGASLAFRGLEGNAFKAALAETMYPHAAPELRQQLEVEELRRNDAEQAAHDARELSKRHLTLTEKLVDKVVNYEEPF